MYRFPGKGFFCGLFFLILFCFLLVDLSRFLSESTLSHQTSLVLLDPALRACDWNKKGQCLCHEVYTACA